jgi:perosamine synthetase
MIPHNRPTLGAEELQAAQRVIASGWVAQGAEVEAFENEVCNFLGLEPGHAIALSSGTAALFLALRVLGAQGREVAFPVYACAALRNAVSMAQGREVLLDVAQGTPNLDLPAARKAVPDLLIAPHMFGLPMDLSSTAGLKVIEDCAQSLGARVNGVATGLRGQAGVLSFYATKLITTGGQGGMLVSRDGDLVAEARDYREFDYRRDQRERFNFQMTDLQAAIGRAQLAQLPEWLARRSRLFEIYRRAGLELMDVAPDARGCEPVRYRAVVRTQNAAAVIKVLDDNGIKSIVPIEDWELLGEERLFPNALELARTTVSLPVHPGLTEREAETIASHVRGAA